MSMVRAYLAMSLDGYVAGPDDDLTWLEPSPSTDAPTAAGEWAQVPEGALQFDQFMAGIGTILMGRRTYDIVLGLGEWPYGDVPMVVATHRPLGDARDTVSADQGTLEDLIHRAKQRAGDKDVYLDGAAMVAGALDAGLLDSLVITMLPRVLGGGISLFGGPAQLTVTQVAKYGDGAVQLHLTPGARTP